MTSRTITQTVTFRRPFRLSGLEEILPAGDYLTETEEERLEGLSFSAYRKTMVLVHLPQHPGSAGHTEILWIAPADLEQALAQDKATSGQSG
jgi:hypothetical protein